MLRVMHGSCEKSVFVLAHNIYQMPVCEQCLLVQSAWPIIIAHTQGAGVKMVVQTNAAYQALMKGSVI